jgi:hypothetical protein
VIYILKVQRKFFTPINVHFNRILSANCSDEFLEGNVRRDLHQAVKWRVLRDILYRLQFANRTVAR